MAKIPVETFDYNAAVKRVKAENRMMGIGKGLGDQCQSLHGSEHDVPHNNLIQETQLRLQADKEKAVQEQLRGMRPINMQTGRPEPGYLCEEECETCAPISQVGEQEGRVMNALYATEELIERLKIRLEPALRPMSGIPNEHMGDKRPELVPIAEWLRMQCEKIEAGNIELQSLLNRLEL